MLHIYKVCRDCKMLYFKKLRGNAISPSRDISKSIAYNLFAAEERTLAPKERGVINTHVSFTFPCGYYGHLLSVPTLTNYKDIDVISTAIVTSSDQVLVHVVNNNEDEVKILPGDKIALMIVAKYYNHQMMFEIS